MSLPIRGLGRKPVFIRIGLPRETWDSIRREAAYWQEKMGWSVPDYLTACIVRWREGVDKVGLAPHDLPFRDPRDVRVLKARRKR